VKHLDFEAVFHAGPADELIADRGVHRRSCLGHAIRGAGLDPVMHGGQAFLIRRMRLRRETEQYWDRETKRVDHEVPGKLAGGLNANELSGPR